MEKDYGLSHFAKAYGYLVIPTPTSSTQQLKMDTTYLETLLLYQSSVKLQKEFWIFTMRCDHEIICAGSL